MKKHILYIDEDTNGLRIFLNAVSKLPGTFKCTYANGSHQAIEMLKRIAPDYIFVDYNLRQLNGLQFLSLVNGHPRLGTSEKYLYSSNVSDELSKMAKVLGASGCIEKTPVVNMLAVELKSVLMPNAS